MAKELSLAQLWDTRSAQSLTEMPRSMQPGESLVTGELLGVLLEKYPSESSNDEALHRRK